MGSTTGMDVRLGCAVALALMTACGSDDDPAGGPRCVAGESVACVGPNGCDGYQVCNDDGQSYGPCDCGSAGAGTGGSAPGGGSGGSATGGSATGGSGTGGGSTGGTGAAPAAGAGGSVAGAGGVVLLGGTGGVAVVCEPADMSGWVPPAYVPAKPAAAVCTEAVIRQYAADCLNGANCAAFIAGGEHAACGDCLTPTPIEDPAYGPLVLSGSLRETNMAGCLELLGAAPCAEHQQAKARCEHEACFGNCPVSDQQSLMDYQTCKEDARFGVCDAYRQAAVCISDPAHIEACTDATFAEAFVGVGMVFCGG